MKNIEINEKQKENLLEMCKVLFPELTDLEIRDSMEDFCFKFEHVCIEYGRQNDNLVIIHWFEFCMTHLAKKLIPKVTKYNLDSAYDSLYNVIYQFWENKHNHIVDYLYEEFKKLK